MILKCNPPHPSMLNHCQVKKKLSQKSDHSSHIPTTTKPTIHPAQPIPKPITQLSIPPDRQSRKNLPFGMFVDGSGRRFLGRRCGGRGPGCRLCRRRGRGCLRGSRRWLLCLLLCRCRRGRRRLCLGLGTRLMDTIPRYICQTRSIE
jgi:hypothetical protein